MTSKLIVNTIEADTGISSVSFASSISMDSTSKFHFSAAGIDIGADTNINRPAAGVIGFNVNGAEKLRIDTNGHLNTSGIATASNFKTGSSNLHSTGLTVGNNFIHTTGINVGTGATIHVPATNVLTLGTNSNERVRITSDGKVGINENPVTAQFEVKSAQLGGTAGNTQEVVRLHSPDVTNNTSYRFTNYRVSNGTSHSSSELRFRRHVDVTDMGYFGLGDLYASIGYGTAEKLRITSDGKMGLGTVSPSGMFEVQKNGVPAIIANYNNSKHIQMGAGSNGAGFHVTTGLFFTINQQPYADRGTDNNLTERLRITSGGDTELRNNVAGINNSYSQYLKFRTTQSNGQSAVTGQIAAQGKSNWGGELVFYSKPANGTPNDSVSERLRISSTGHVTKPASCAFNVTPNGNQSLGNGEALTSWKTTDSRGFENTTTGGYFSGGIFTAPVTGAYFFTSNILLYDTNGTNSIHLYWQKNGSGTHTYWNTRFNSGDFGYQNYMPVAGACTMYMSAGDTCRIRISFTGSNCGMYGGDQNLGNWGGFLIG